MNKSVGNKRLLRLAEFLTTVPRKRFDYSTWVGKNWAGSPDLSCGTTACAFGWAATMPFFQGLGLRLERRQNPEYPSSVNVGISNEKRGLPWRGYYDNPTLTVAADTFGVTEDEAAFLFVPASYGNDDSPGMDATPKQVATHIRKFVKARANGV